METMMGGWDGLVNLMETKPRADGAFLDGAKGDGEGGQLSHQH